MLVTVKHKARVSVRVREKRFLERAAALKGGKYGRKYPNPFYGFFAC